MSKQFNFRSEHQSQATAQSQKQKNVSGSSSKMEKVGKQAKFKSVTLIKESPEEGKVKFHSESTKSNAFTSKKEQSSSNDKTSSFSPYKFICVLDFEALFADDCKTNRNYDMEIIEFPSVLLRYEKEKELVVVDQIQNYVKTRRIPKLNEECIKLTGITQEVVDSGVSFEEALKRHNDWLFTHLQEKPTKDNVLICTCGDWDIKTMIPHQVYHEKNTINLVGSHFTQWCNVKDVFAKFYNMKKVNGMLTMLNALKLPLIGQHHSGIDDCKNIARVVCQMVKEGCYFDATAKLTVNHGISSRTKKSEFEYTNYDPNITNNQK